MKRFFKLNIISIIILIGYAELPAQSFGFGCLGLSGFYAGFSNESYDASGINAFMTGQFQTGQIPAQIKFEKGTGYRIGANFVRAQFDQFFISAKGYYQFLKEEHTTSELSGTSIVNSSHKLSLNHWGVGIDLGVKLFWILDWKAVEGNINFYDGNFTSEYSKDNIPQSSSKYNSDKIQIGYFAGTGLVLHIVPDYISLEGTAGYHFNKLDIFRSTDAFGNEIDIKNAVSKGGFGLTVQLNVGFPL
ncbi:MAG: hypothetical protein WC061_06955 [Melioribacteraceae bacterium]